MRNRIRRSALGFVLLVLLVGMAAPGISSAVEAPVAEAAKNGNTEGVRSLLRDGADVNAAEGDGMTALHWTALNGDVDTMQVLLYAGANLEPLTRLGGYTPLHLAAREGEGAAVAALLTAGAAVDRYTDTGVTALHLAAEAGDAEAVAALIAHDADIDARDEGAERTPLMYAAVYNRIDALRMLIDAGADVALETRVVDYVKLSEEDSRSQRRRRAIVEASKPAEPEEDEEPGAQAGNQQGAALRAAAQRNLQQAQQQGQQTPPDPDDPPQRGQRGQQQGQQGEQRGQQQGQQGEQRQQQGQQGQTPPDEPPARAGRGGQTPPDPDDPAEPEEPTPDPNIPRSLSNTEQIGRQGGFTAMHYAVRDGHFDAAMMLLEAGTDIDHRTAGDQSTPMLMAIINGNFDIGKELLDRGADPNMVSEDGVGPLFAVINNEWQLRTWYPQPTAGQQQQIGYLDMMRVLLEAGADPNQRTNQHIWYAAYNAGRMGVEFAGATAFWRAAYATDVAAMKLLVEYGADPNISTMKLAGGRRRGGGDDEEDPSGMPEVEPGGPHVHPLHAATGVGFGTSRVGQQHRHVPDGWLPAVQYLVGELEVDVNVLDADGYSAVHNAAARGDNEVIEYLVEHGADVTFVSRRGQTTVDMANGPQQRVQPFPETIALLESLGAINNHNCISC